jgi:pimeloyl-ACP methyl ester carboxylesterase
MIPETPLRISEALHKRIPKSQLAVFERSGHSPFLEEADRFAQVLGAFLR